VFWALSFEALGPGHHIDFIQALSMWVSGVEINGMDLDARLGRTEHSTKVAGQTALLLGMAVSNFLMDLFTWASGVEIVFMDMGRIT